MIFSRTFAVIAAVIVFSNVSRAAQPSIAASLAGYVQALGIEQIDGIPDSNVSGVAYNPNTKTLFLVDNNTCTIYELSKGGVVLRTIRTTGFEDMEGIAFQKDSFFFVTEEQRGNIDRIVIPEKGNGMLHEINAAVFNVAKGFGNSGLEGVSYCVSNATVYSVKEKDPPRLYRIVLDSVGNPKEAFPNDPFNLENNSGDAADIFALADGNFILDNQEENKLIGYGPTGLKLSELKLPQMTQPEGITVDTSDATIYVVGEKRQFFVFKPKTKISSLPPATNSLPDIFIEPKTAASRLPVLRLRLSKVSSATIAVHSALGAEFKIINKVLSTGIHEIPLPIPHGFHGILICSCTIGSWDRTVKCAVY